MPPGQFGDAWGCSCLVILKQIVLKSWDSLAFKYFGDSSEIYKTYVSPSLPISLTVEKFPSARGAVGMGIEAARQNWCKLWMRICQRNVFDEVEISIQPGIDILQTKKMTQWLKLEVMKNRMKPQSEPHSYHKG